MTDYYYLPIEFHTPPISLTGAELGNIAFRAKEISAMTEAELVYMKAIEAGRGTGKSRTEIFKAAYEDLVKAQGVTYGDSFE